MKLKDVPTVPFKRDGSPVSLPRGTRASILKYVADRPTEVFSANGDEIADALTIPVTTVRHALWTLARDGFLGKAKLTGVWYGSHKAIRALSRSARAEGIDVEVFTC